MHAGISLRHVTADTVRAIANLRVSAEQESYVASNAVSIAQAYFHPEAWFRAIYAQDVPVGFVMLEDQTLVPKTADPPPIGLWRFMIDQRYQRSGFGRAALQLVVDHVRSRPGQTGLLTSYVPGPHCPEGFYLGFGFQHTGEMDGDEIVLKLTFMSAGAAQPGRA